MEQWKHDYSKGLKVEIWYPLAPKWFWASAKFGTILSDSNMRKLVLCWAKSKTQL